MAEVQYDRANFSPGVDTPSVMATPSAVAMRELHVEDIDEAPLPFAAPANPQPDMHRKSLRYIEAPAPAAGSAIDDLMKRTIVTGGQGGGGGGGGSSSLPDPGTMQKDVKQLQARLRKMDRMLLNPRSKLMQYWDFATLSALFFTATVTPFEVCLMWEEKKFWDPDWLNALFVINWIVNLVFMIDICFNFFLPYKESAAKGGGTVKSHRKIWRNYACGWFPLDFVSVIPVDNIMMAINTSEIRGASVLGAIRMLRLLRLIKLARILRASRIFSRWENSISIPYPRQSLIFWFLMVVFTLHILACALGLLAQLMGPPRSLELELAVQSQMDANDASCYGCTPSAPLTPDGLCKSLCLTPCEVMKLAELRAGPNAYPARLDQEYNLIKNEEAWPCRYAQSGQIRAMPTYNGELYAAALYVAMIQLGGGVGSIVPMNFAEYVVFLVAIFAGSVLWAMVVGTICATLSTGDPHTNTFKANMDNLNYFLEDMQMPSELRIRAREYLRNGRDLIKKASYNELIGTLSPSLRADVVLTMSAKTLEQVWYLSECEQMARVELATRLTRAGFPSREKVASDHLTILMRGVAAKAGSILTPISHWGHDIIVTAPALRDLRPANALTYVEVACLSRVDLMEVLEDFPKSASVIRQAGMKVAMRRAVVIISEYIRSRQDLQASRETHGKQAAHRSMMSAFGGGNSHDPSADPTMILRLITGSNLKDIVDGHLVEEVENEADEGDVAQVKKELKDVKSDLAELKGMMRQLLER